MYIMLWYQIGKRINRFRVNYQRYYVRECAIFYRDPPPTSKYYQQHMPGGARTQALGHPVGQSQGQPDRHWLKSVSRREVSEVSLLLMVSGRRDAERSMRGGKGREEHECAGKGVGV